MMRRALRCFTILIVTIVPATALAQSSPSNFTSAVRYDDRNRVTGTIAPDDDGAAPFSYLATRTTYDDVNHKVTVETGAFSSWQSDTIAPSAWSGFTLFSKVETQGDLLDRKAVESAWAWDTSLATPAWVQKTLTQYSYDPVGRPECVAVRMDPATWASLPASACTLATSGTAANADRITKTVYDDAGQVLKVVKAVGTPLQQDYVTYTYSANGKPLSVKDANGNLAGYTYDGHDRLTTWSFPDKTATGSVSTSDYEAYTYDLNGNRETMRKRDGRTFTYYYDNLNRMTAKIVPDSCVGDYACTTPPADATRDVYYGYDARGQQLFAAFNAATGTDRIDNDYDGFGRLRSQITAMYGVSRTVSYLYDADGNRVRITHPDSVYFTTDYDGLDRATAVKENGSTTIASMTYDAQGREGSETRDTVTTTFGYDGIGRLSSLADDLPGGTTNDIATTFDYNYASQLTSRIRSNPSPYAWGGYGIIRRSYTANGLNQYAGSVSTVSGETMAPVAYGYDANGNLVSTGTESYGYDAENRLVTDSAGGGTTFAYDPLGRLYGYGGTASKSSVYDGDQRIVDYTANASVIQQRYVMGPGTDNPLVWYYGAGLSDRRSLQADERGSIVSAVDATGTLIGINSYDEYGIPAASNTGRYGYTGQVWIATLGMWYYKARFYSPSLGRFMQTDPIGYADQNNLYAYVGNDPMDGVDPSGLFGYLNGGEGCPAGSSCTTTDLAATSEAINRGSASSGQAQSPNTKSQLGEGGPDGPKPGIGHNGGPPIEGTGGRLLGRLLGAVGAIITDILFPDPAGPPKEGIGPYVAANGTQVSGRFPIKSSPNAMLYRMSNGKITNYQTYDKSGYPRLRVDLAGKSHARIATPHAVEYTVYIGPNGQVSVNPGPTRPTNLLELP